MQSNPGDEVIQLLREFAELPYSDAKAFMAGIEYQPRIGRLLSKYGALSVADAKRFSAGVNEFIFASVIRKQSMIQAWTSNGKPGRKSLNADTKKR